jgi:hypothetical protein
MESLWALGASVEAIDALLRPVRIRCMTQITEAELKEIGRRAAQLVPSLGTVEDVAVKAGQDSTDQPAYFFLS